MINQIFTWEMVGNHQTSIHVKLVGFGVPGKAQSKAARRKLIEASQKKSFVSNVQPDTVVDFLVPKMEPQQDTLSTLCLPPKKKNYTKK